MIYGIMVALGLVIISIGFMQAYRKSHSPLIVGQPTAYKMLKVYFWGVLVTFVVFMSSSKEHPSVWYVTGFILIELCVLGLLAIAKHKKT